MELTQETINNAKAELEAVCIKHNILLVPVVVHQGNNTFSSIEIVPRQSVQPNAEAPEAPAAE